jgi:hypothetical protein
LIQNGNLTAIGSAYGAGIGSGYSYGGTSSVGNISILNGSVTAIGSANGAGIGSGQSSSGGTSSVGNISILNGSVTAGSTYGAGIGSGRISNGVSSVVSVSLINSRINARGYTGIGNGHGSRVEDLLISGGSDTVSGSPTPMGMSGPGIGSGQLGSMSNLRIDGVSLVIEKGIYGIGAQSRDGLENLTIGSAHIDCRAIGAVKCIQGYLFY